MPVYTYLSIYPSLFKSIIFGKKYVFVYLLIILIIYKEVCVINWYEVLYCILFNCYILIGIYNCWKSFTIIMRN